MGIHLEAADYIGARFGEERSREDFLKEVIIELRDFPGVQWLRLQAPNAGDLGSIPA